jgi:hypothetical protein
MPRPSEGATSGIVNVVYGSSTGLNLGQSQAWTQNTSGILDTAEDGDRFGSTLY